MTTVSWLGAMTNGFRALAAAVAARRPRSIPYVQQLAASDCGAACLAMVLKYHGKDVSLGELRDKAVSARDATDAQTLIDTADTYGHQPAS